MKKIDRDNLIPEDEFLFCKLTLSGIDNGPILRVNPPRLAEEEFCLLHRSFHSGDDYLLALHRAVADSVLQRAELPVVRFADGEYAFYGHSLNCNGLYQQAESRRAIRKSMPEHITALRRLSEKGILAPLIFSGNLQPRKKRWFRILFRGGEGSSLEFLAFLSAIGIRLRADRYIPFYIVYAYLTSKLFATWYTANGYA